jgi:hypothetical protein
MTNVMHVYSYDEKKALANKITRIKKKEYLVEIFEIIHQDNKSISENDNGMFMIFNQLDNKTFDKLDKFFDKMKKKDTEDRDSEMSKSEYKPYSKSEFPDQEKLSPKYKYTNKERNIIKRQRYDKILNDDSEQSNIIYKEFDTENMTESDVKSTDKKVNEVTMIKSKNVTPKKIQAKKSSSGTKKTKIPLKGKTTTV